jgi:NAD(P)-dependent dehydrogenase (short-subunit alcohol dehydrogenase family)
MGPYSAMKAAAVTLLQHYCAEHSPRGLRVHSIHPGAIFTKAAEDMGMTADFMEWDDKSLPSGLVLWLGSDRSRFLNGRILHATWDVEKLEAREKEFEEDKALLKLGSVGCGCHELFNIVF